MVFALSAENPQLAWSTFTTHLDALTAANPGNRPNTLAKSIPEVFWSSVPLDALQAWVEEHLDPGMAETLANSMETARFRLDERTRLVKAADRFVSHPASS